jgi:hypothetical protein
MIFCIYGASLFVSRVTTCHPSAEDAGTGCMRLECFELYAIALVRLPFRGYLMQIMLCLGEDWF